MEQTQLNSKIDCLNSELIHARTQLTQLRSRLLEDNLTQYLEVSGSPNSPYQSGHPAGAFDTSLPAVANPNDPPISSANHSQTRLDQMKSLFRGSEESQSGFLNRARALATKPFGASASNAIDTQATNDLGYQSRPPTARQGVDYGSVW